MPGSLEARTESSEACDTIGKAIHRSSHEGRSTGNIDPRKSMTGDPVHPTILFSVFSQPAPFGNSMEAKHLLL